MSSDSATKISGQNSKGKRLGFGYEKRSSESPSTQTARSTFLRTLLERKPDAVSELFNSAYGSFEELLQSKEDLLGARYEALESTIPTEAYILRQPKFLRARAIESIIPDWLTLQKLSGAEVLIRCIEVWASKHNLTDLWCLNHAITFLREFEGADGRNMAFALWRSHQDHHYLSTVARGAWEWAVHKSCDALRAQIQTSVEFEERGPYSFEFSYESLRFTVIGPIFKSKADFKKEVDENFKSAGGPSIRGAKKALTHQLREFEDEFRTTMRNLGLEEPPVRWAADKHIEWLVDYQVPPWQTYRGLAGDDKNEKTVREGVQDVANLIGLTLRVSKLGRRPGVAETVVRRRAQHH